MTVKELKKRFDGGFFIDIEEFHKVETRIKFNKVHKCQDIIKNFPNIIATNPQDYKYRFFISHRWDSPKDPDKRNWQIDALHQFASEMVAKGKTPACFWYDYCSLPQSPRTKTEEYFFKSGLKKINYLCRNCTVIALVSATHINGNVSIKNMLKRGWILVELFIAEHHNKIHFALFEGTRDYITFSKVERLNWRNTIPDLLALLPSYDKNLIRRWFDINKIKCTNGADLDLVAGYLSNHIYSYIRTISQNKPIRLKSGETTTMTASEISKYYINKHGLTPLFPNTYFSTEYLKHNSYKITPYHRPKLPPLDKQIVMSESNFQKFGIDNKSGLSKMYPGIKFKVKKQKNGYYLFTSMIKKIDWNKL